MINPLVGFVRELKRRKVFRVAALYGVIAWGLIEVAETTSPLLDLPGWVPRLVLFLCLIGFPLALVLTWAFDLTPEGVRRAPDPSATEVPVGSGRRMAGYGSVGVLVVVGAVGAYLYTGGSDSRLDSDGPIRSVAVLPFVDLSPDGDQEYFSDGITEELLDALARIEGLRVPARTSSFAFKGQEIDIREVARRLDVEAVLEGSVRRSGDRIRITAQLIEGGSGYHLWSETYDRRLTDIFAVQDEISAEIVDALRVRLTPEERERLGRSGTEDVLAYDLYLRAREYMRRSPQSPTEVRLAWFSAIALLREALREDPEYAPAWAALAESHLHLDFDLSDAARVDSASTFARRAITLDPDLPDGHVALGLAYADLNDFDRAEEQLQTAYELNPNHAEALRAIAELNLFRWGRAATTIRLAERSLQVDPANQDAYQLLVDAYWVLGRYDRAEEWARRSNAAAPHPGLLHCTLAGLSMFRGDRHAVGVQVDSMLHREPDGPFAAQCAVLPEIYLGRFEDAERYLERYAASVPADQQPLVLSAFFAKRRGEDSRAAALLDEAETRIRERIEAGSEEWSTHLAAARLHVLRGDPEAAVASLLDSTEPVEEKWWWYHDLRTDPLLDPLRGHPGFERLMDELGSEVERVRDRVAS